MHLVNFDVYVSKLRSLRGKLLMHYERLVFNSFVAKFFVFENLLVHNQRQSADTHIFLWIFKLLCKLCLVVGIFYDASIPVSAGDAWSIDDIYFSHDTVFFTPMDGKVDRAAKNILSVQT